MPKYSIKRNYMRDEIYEEEKDLQNKSISFLSQLVTAEIKTQSQGEDMEIFQPNLEVLVYILKKICQ